MATANAHPTKRFFIQSLIRDLSLEDAILDLVDNSIDALVRKRNFSVSPSLLATPPTNGAERRPDVILQIGEDEFSITDYCGGIEPHRAETEIFRFGFVRSDPGSLSVFGIGLKRAMFKIGRQITLESRTISGGFRVEIDAEQWMNEDERWEDWTFPVIETEAAASEEEAGTRITIRQLNPEAVMKIRAGGVLNSLRESLALTYSIFLQHLLRVNLNGVAVQPKRLPLASSELAEYGHRKLNPEGVQVDLFTGLAPREAGEWNAAIAGWYVLCNGRVVVAADKTQLTGWGDQLPIFAPKYRGFIGIAFFFSQDPSRLPWTTTKRGLHQEAYVYQAVKKEMFIEGRRVISFLNRMYPGDVSEEVPERKVVDTVAVVDVGNYALDVERGFRPKISRSAPKTTVKVQYTAEIADIDRIRKTLGRPEWSASTIGKHTFDHFLRTQVA